MTDARLRGIVDAFVADLTVLVRQTALDAVRQALGREEPSVEPAPRKARRRPRPAGKRPAAKTRVVELVPAAPPKRKRRRRKPVVASEPALPVPAPTPQPEPLRDHDPLRDAIVEQPGAEQLAQALDAEPGAVATGEGAGRA